MTREPWLFGAAVLPSPHDAARGGRRRSHDGRRTALIKLSTILVHKGYKSQNTQEIYSLWVVHMFGAAVLPSPHAATRGGSCVRSCVHSASLPEPRTHSNPPNRIHQMHPPLEIGWKFRPEKSLYAAMFRHGKCGATRHTRGARGPGAAARRRARELAASSRAATARA